jgi:hypothetical protein
MTTTRPPRSVIAASSSFIRGACTALPWETSGLAPSISRKSVRGRSGNGSWVSAPYSSLLATKRLLMSCDPGEYWWVAPSAPKNPPTQSAVA